MCHWNPADVQGVPTTPSPLLKNGTWFIKIGTDVLNMSTKFAFTGNDASVWRT
jgi:hypothetical protein